MIYNFTNRSNQLLNRIKDNLLPLLLLLTLTIFTYWEVTTHSVLINWDDHIYVTNNYAIRGFSWQNLKTVFSQYYVGNYAPMQMISYMVDFTIWGKTPLGYFLANIGYHFVSAVFLYFLLIRIGFLKWGAFLGTAVFLVHPLQVESVAWISQRKNLLAMLLYLLSFHAYLSYIENNEKKVRRWYYFWSVFAFTLALLSKSVAVIFPVMLVMYDQLIMTGRRNHSAYLDKIPYFAAAGMVAVIAMISQQSWNGGGRIDYPQNPLVTLPLTMLPVLVRYLNLLVCPLPSLQSVMYFSPLRTQIDPIVIFSLFILVCLIAAGIYLYRKNRPCLFWYSLFFLGLVPVSQIVPLVTMMNDRYMYFPMLGVAGFVAYLSNLVYERPCNKLLVKLLLAISVCVVLTFSFASYQRGKVWKNTISLFSDAVAKYPDSTDAWSRLAEGYVASGDLTMAQYYYENGARFGSLDGDARHNLAKIYLLTGEYEKAYQHIWWLMLNGDRSKILIGEYFYRIGSYPEAFEYIFSYLEENPGNSDAFYLLGRVHFMTGNYQQARENFNHAVNLEESSASLYYGIACLEAVEGHPVKSFEALKTAFEKGLKSKNIHEDEKCLAWIKSDPRLRQLIWQTLGE